MNSHTVIYTASRPEQAHMLRNLLEEQGIRALVLNEPLRGALGMTALGWPTNLRVVVAEQDVLAARTLAEQFERRWVYTEPTQDETETGELPRSLVWPECPRCETPRPTTCPACNARGSDFALADPPWAEGFEPAAEPAPETWEPAEPSVSGGRTFRVDERAQLVCLTCGDVFSPRFERYCPQCEYDYGDGDEPRHDFDKPSPRVRFVAVTMLLIVAALLAIAFVALRLLES